MKNMDLKIIPLGGLNEIGKNMTVYETENDIIVVDCGLMFPEDELLGIDVVIPDFSYLKQNIDKVRALFITHAHEDHIGAIPYFLKEINVPIYSTRFTLGIIETKLKEFKFEVEKHVIKSGDVIEVGDFKVEPIRVSHSTPDSMSFAIDTPVGIIMHTGDFKVDYSPIDGQRMELEKFARFGDKGIVALLSDSTNATHEGYTMSESLVGETFDTLFRHAHDARIIIASFASNVHRIQQIINVAIENKRKIALSGRSMVNVVTVAQNLGYLHIPENTLIDIREIDKYADNEIVVITTGSQGEPMSALARMANSEHKLMEIKHGDLVILSSSPIPGNEKSVYGIINKLTQKGANVIYEALEDVHVSGHARREELKLMLALTRPKYFIPVHGEYIHLRSHKQLAEDMGVNPNDIFIIGNGSVMEFKKQKDRVTAKIKEVISCGRTLVDGLGIGDIGTHVLRDRKHLSEDGLMLIAIAVDKDTKTIISNAELITRGFIYVKNSEELMTKSRFVVEKEMAEYYGRTIQDYGSLKLKIKDVLGQFIYKETKRSPMILTVFVEV